MPSEMPAIDANSCGDWTENDKDMYKKYPFWLAQTQVERRKTWLTFKKLTKKRNWKPNMGSTMRGVRKNPSPHIRQFAFPNPLTERPTTDYVNVTETATDAILYWHEFESPVFYFLPSFTDFLDHVSDTGEDLMEKIERYEELFTRGMMFHMCPFMFVAQGNTVALVNTTPFDGLTLFDPATMGKSTAVLAGILANEGATATHLTMPALSVAMTKMSVNLGIPPFSGNGMPAGDNEALSQKYALITHEEAWTQFSFDPYLQQHKNCDLDVVNGAFRGSLFGRMTAKLESLPMFMKNDASFAEPETRVDNNLNLNQGETVPNPDYAEIVNSPWAISFLAGGQGYEEIDSGPPPSVFTKETPPDGFQGMKWNGEVYLTRNFLLECTDAAGNVKYKSNDRGRYVRYQADLTLGIFPKQRRNIIPILHKRKQTV